VKPRRRFDRKRLADRRRAPPRKIEFRRERRRQRNGLTAYIAQTTGRSVFGRFDPTRKYDEMAADDVEFGGGAVSGDVGECRRRGRTTGDDVCRRGGRRRQVLLGDVRSGRPATRRDDTTANCRQRTDGQVAARFTQRSAAETSPSSAAFPGNWTSLTPGADHATRGSSSHMPMNARLTDAAAADCGRIWQSNAVGNSILRRPVSVAVHRRRHRGARSRWRRPSEAAPGPAGCAAAALLLTATLLVGSVAADHGARRFRGESSSSARGGRQPASPAASGQSRDSPPRRSDDVGAGTPCVYEGHIKTDRYLVAVTTNIRLC